MKIEKMNIKDMDVIKVEIPIGYEYSGVDIDGNLIMTKKKPSYPKNISDCCEIHNLPYVGNDYIAATMLGLPINNFAKLLIARDAYWKIDNNWKPMKSPAKDEKRYVITRMYDEVVQMGTSDMHYFVLEFRTKELRDAFYENFIDLIHKCKEFL